MDIDEGTKQKLREIVDEGRHQPDFMLALRLSTQANIAHEEGAYSAAQTLADAAARLARLALAN